MSVLMVANSTDRIYSFQHIALYAAGTAGGGPVVDVLIDIFLFCLM